jgi:hypothetical protein
LKKYRRIEVNAFRRRVTVVSGEWRPDDLFEAPSAETSDEVTLNDTDSCEPVAPDSPEGQMILVEAVRSLERRLSPEARAMIRDVSKDSHRELQEFNSDTDKGQ